MKKIVFFPLLYSLFFTPCLLYAQEIEFIESEESKCDEDKSSESYFYGDFLTRFSFDTGLECICEDEGEILTIFNTALKHSKKNFSINVGGRFSYWGGIEGGEEKRFFFLNGKNYKGEFDAELREANIIYNFKNLSFGFGNQIFRWGETTIFNPLNQINPIDYRYGIFSTEESPYIPVFSGDLSLKLSYFLIEAVVVPFFYPNKFFLYGRDYSISYGKADYVPFSNLLKPLTEFIHPSIEDKIQPYLIASEFPDEILSNFSTGARFLYENKRIKGGISYFYGWDRTPFIELDPDLSLVFFKLIETSFDREKIFLLLGDKDFQDALKRIEKENKKIGDLYKSEYKRLHSFGYETSLNLDPLFFHIEGAFQPQRTLYTEKFLPLRKPILTNDFGIEYNYETDFDLTLELSYVHIFDVENIPLFLIKEDLFTLGGILHYRPLKFEKLTLRIIFIYGITLNDIILSPMLTLKANEKWHLSIGGNFLDGKKGSIGYFFDRNDEIFFQSDFFF